MNDAVTDKTTGPAIWWRARASRPVLAMLALVALALVGGVLLILSVLGDERQLREISREDSQILAALHEVRGAVVDAETGQRGYYITTDERYLAPYLSGRKRLVEALGRLERLTRHESDPDTQVRYNELALVTRERLRDLDDTVAMLRRNDRIAAQDRTFSGNGLESMAKLRGLTEQLEQQVGDEMRDSTEAVARAEAQMVPLLLALLAVIVIAIWLAVRLALRTADAEARAAQASELAQARDRADLLARELNHRVKNLFAVVLAIVQMSGRGSPEATPVIDRIFARIQALVRSHDVTQGKLGSSGDGFRALLETVLAPHHDAANGFELDGPDLALPENTMVSLGLMLHELATNAVKYGAWSRPGGHLAVRWRIEAGPPRHLLLTWREQSAAAIEPAGEARGFGSLLLSGTVRQLHGTYERRFLPDGMELEVDLTLDPAA